MYGGGAGVTHALALNLWTVGMEGPPHASRARHVERKSSAPLGLKDETVARASAGPANGLDPMHGLRLAIREEAARFENSPT
jgi:hypothetical protein